VTTSAKLAEWNPLFDRLRELQISPEELAQLVNRPLEEVKAWIDAESLPGEAKILTRFLADDADALRRVEFLRRSYTRNLLSDAQRREQASNTTTLESIDDGRHYESAGSPS
jgi:hypothetical protein